MTDATSTARIPASSVYTTLRGIAATLSAIQRQTEDLPPHAAVLMPRQTLGKVRKEAGLSQECYSARRFEADRRDDP